MVDDFSKAFFEARENKDSGGKRQRINLGFTPIIFEEDEYFANGFDYTLQEAARQKIKSAGVITNGGVDFYIRSQVLFCELLPQWHAPHYSVRDYIVRTEKRKWRDKDGKEHEMKITYYDQVIDEHFAYWMFIWAVGADFWLVDEDNNVIISGRYNKIDDKPVDAYRHAAEDFCKKVNTVFKNQ